MIPRSLVLSYLQHLILQDVYVWLIHMNHLPSHIYSYYKFEFKALLPKDRDNS